MAGQRFAHETLRAQVRHIEGRHALATVLPFGLGLPGGVGSRVGHRTRPLTAAVARPMVQRLPSLPLLCRRNRCPGQAARYIVRHRKDRFAPALSQAGLKSDRVIYLEGGDL